MAGDSPQRQRRQSRVSKALYPQLPWSASTDWCCSANMYLDCLIVFHPLSPSCSMQVHCNLTSNNQFLQPTFLYYMSKEFQLPFIRSVFNNWRPTPAIGGGCTTKTRHADHGFLPWCGLRLWFCCNTCPRPIEFGLGVGLGLASCDLGLGLVALVLVLVLILWTRSCKWHEWFGRAGRQDSERLSHA